MSSNDIVIVSQSETVNYDKYSQLPLDRIDLYRDLVQLRMIYHEGGFRSHLDIINKAVFGEYFGSASFNIKRKMFSVWNLPGLNGFSIAAALENHGFRVALVNNFDAQFDLLIQYLSNMDEPLLGLSTTFILQWSEISRIIKRVRKKVPECKFILGGAFVSNLFLQEGVDRIKTSMQKMDISYVLYALNSETDMVELMKSLKGKSSNALSKVPNLIYIDKDGACHDTTPMWHDPDFALTSPLWDKMYRPELGSTVQIRTSMGCPFKCAFCSYPIVARGLHQNDLQGIGQQLEMLKTSGDVKAVVFIDDTINVPPARFSELVKLMEQYPFRWYAFLRVQFLTDELAKRMKQSGCDGVYLGLESASDTILSNMNKKARRKDYVRGVELLNKYAIPSYAMFIIGFPGETPDTLEDTLDFINNSGIMFYSLKEFYYMKSSPIHSQRKQYGLQGGGNVWSHDTMNSIQASEAKLDTFRKVSNSQYVDSDMGLWYLISLREKGLNWSQINQVQEIIIKASTNDLNGQYHKNDHIVADVKRCLAETGGI